MPEVASEVSDAMRTLARALCGLAVERHASNLGEHAEMAACLWIHVESDFRETKISPQIQDWMNKFLQIAPKKMR